MKRFEIDPDYKEEYLMIKELWEYHNELAKSYERAVKDYEEEVSE